MPTDLQTSLHSVSDQIISIAESDNDFKEELLSLVKCILHSVDVQSSTDELVQDEDAPVGSAVAKIAHSNDQANIDLELVAERCHVKAESCRWAAERLRLVEEGACHRTEIAPFDREIIKRANELTDCRLWMNCPSSPVPDAPALFEVAGGCFEALGASVAFARVVDADLPHHRHMLGEALQLVAEAQSALRSAIQKIDGPSDHDQIQSYQWVKLTASKHRIFIKRFVCSGDLADPNSWADILACVETFSDQVCEARGIERRRRKLLRKLKYQLEQASNANEDEQLVCWNTVARTLDNLVQAGMSPSNLKIQALLFPHIDEVPDLGEAPQGFELALRETKRFGDTNIPEQSRSVGSETTADARNVAKLLNGKTAVLIGGECRSARKEALETAFGLSELVWIETKPHDSFTKFVPYVARPEVAVVLLSIRWCSHSFKEVKRFCDRYDIPLVRLPAGLNPHQVAAHILGQCGDRLKSKTSQWND